MFIEGLFLLRSHNSWLSPINFTAIHTLWYSQIFPRKQLLKIDLILNLFFQHSDQFQADHALANHCQAANFQAGRAHAGLEGHVQLDRPNLNDKRFRKVVRKIFGQWIL